MKLRHAILLAACFCSISSSVFAFERLFDARIVYAVGTGPYSIIAVDLDGDGDADLAAANQYTDNVSILRNKGDGTYSAAEQYAAGDAPRSVCAADVDGDGNVDLAAANYGSYSVSMLRNNGNATFAAAVNYPAGIRPCSICASDLNGDGSNDLVTANSVSEDVSVFRNNGDGTFAEAIHYGVRRNPYSVCAADIDSDGAADLAVANYISDNVSLLINIRSTVATLLQSCAVSLTGRSVRVSWTLSEMDGDARFSAFRAQAPAWAYEMIEDAAIVRDGVSFAWVDETILPGMVYKYRVDYRTDNDPSRRLFETEAVAVPALSATLFPNYPNPFNPSTAVSYYVPQKGFVTVEIYDIAGRRIARLVDEEREQGFYVAKWDGLDDRGRAAASGIYFCRLAVGKERSSIKIVLLR